MPNFTPYRYKADVYTKTRQFDESGQSVETWTFDRTIKCNFMPSRVTERLVGRVQNPHSYYMWTEDEDVTYADQIWNVRNVFETAVEANTKFNVIGIRRFAGLRWVHHVELDLQAVIQ